MLIKKTPTSSLLRQQLGFTLIEIMLVLALIGVMVSLVQISFRDDQLENDLQKESRKFAALFETAAEYSMLNNVEIGLVVNDEGYQFVGYDGTRWTSIPQQETFTDYTLPEHIAIELQLEDLQIDETVLFTKDTYKVEEDNFGSFSLEENEEEEKIIPQVVILSGGDISPFKITFSPADAFAEKDVRFEVTGLYYVPLNIVGPLFDGEEYEANDDRE